MRKRPPKPEVGNWQWIEADYKTRCESCGARPIMPDVGLCAACCFGEAKAQEDLRLDGGYWKPL